MTHAAARPPASSPSEDRRSSRHRNRTEQQIRFVVIDRKVTQVTKAPSGKQLYPFLVEAIQAKLGIKHCYPSLIY